MVAPVIWDPLAAGYAAIWPITCDGSMYAPGEMAARSTVVVTGRLMRVESGMSTRRRRRTGGRDRRGVLPPDEDRIPTKATIAED